MILTALLVLVASECDDRAGDLSAAECLSHAGDVADADLNKIWPGMVRIARERDMLFSPSPGKSKPSAEKDLLASQSAWLKHRASQCALQADYAQGGSLEPVIYSRCYLEMTRQRIKQLKDVVEGFQES